MNSYRSLSPCVITVGTLRALIRNLPDETDLCFAGERGASLNVQTDETGHASLSIDVKGWEPAPARAAALKFQIAQSEPVA